MNKKTQKYIILVVVMTLLFFGASVSGNFVQNFKRTAFRSELMRTVFVLQFLIYCVAGMIFGLEKFLNEWEQNGYWKINLSKLLIIGVPSFLIGIIYILYFIFNYIPPVFIGYDLFVNFMQMLFGYTILTSFYKTEEIPSDNKLP